MSASVFVSTAPFAFFDYFRVPYRVVGGSPPAPVAGAASLAVGDARLWWLPPARGVKPARHLLDGRIPIVGVVTADEVVGPPLLRAGWRPLLTILADAGGAEASVWHHPDGSVFLPFDPGEVMTCLWSERYHDLEGSGLASAAMGLARRAYYRLRPLLPRSLQIRLRQRFRAVQQRATFPAWPLEPALHDLYDLLFHLVAGTAGRPVPYVSLWPGGHAWALVLTHDVETAVGQDHLHQLRELEVSLGLRSSWNFVPRRYTVDERLVAGLWDDGFEVGVHGLYHDGRDLGSLRTFRRRLPATHAHARRWGAHGFRSPALHRVWEWMPQLAFAYDSSYPDTDPYQPMPGGCCSLLPYHNGQLVELPITLAQDFVLFELLEQADEALWVEKAAFVRERGGMALVLTHPDYMREPARREAYARFLTAAAADTTAWRALPMEVAAWWRRRAASQVRFLDGSWEVLGPAGSEAHVAFAGDPAWTSTRAPSEVS